MRATVSLALILAIPGQAIAVMDAPPHGKASGASVAQRRITVADYVTRRQVMPLRGTDAYGDVVSVSPDGRRMAYQVAQGNAATNQVTLTWFVASTSRGVTPIAVGDGGEVTIGETGSGIKTGSLTGLSAARWSPDGRWIAYLLKRDGEVQLWRSRSDGDGSEQLTRNPADVRDFAWSEDGREILFVANRRARAEIARVRELDGERGFLVDLKSYRPMYGAVPPPGKETDADLWKYDLATRVEAKLTDTDQQILKQARSALDPFQSPRFAGLPFHQSASNDGLLALSTSGSQLNKPVRSGDGNRFAFLSAPKDDAGPSNRFVSQMTVSAGSFSAPSQYKSCPLRECRGVIHRIWISNFGDKVYFLKWREPNFDVQELYRWTVDTGKVDLIYSDHFDSFNCVQDNDRLICRDQGVTYPDVIASIDLATGRKDTLVDLNPEFRSIAFSRFERLGWKWSKPGGDQDETTGLLIYPRNYEPGRKYPLVVITYRAEGFIDDSTSREYPAHLFADAGVMVVVVNRTLSPLWSDPLGKNQYRLGWPALRNDLTAIEKIIDQIQARGLVDTGRMAIVGFSWGTQITEFALTQSKYKFATAILSSNTKANMTEFLIEESYREGVDSRHWGPDWSLARSASHTNIPPLLFNLPSVEVAPAMEALVSLRRHGRPFEAYVYPDAYHEKWQPAQRAAIYRRNTQWLRFWLLGEEDGDPIDSSQYRRWNSLRNGERGARSAGGAQILAGG